MSLRPRFGQFGGPLLVEDTLVLDCRGLPRGWNSIKSAAHDLGFRPERVYGLKTIRVDEHIRRPSRTSSTDKDVTVIIDLIRGAHKCRRARLLDAVHGCSGRDDADWLVEQGFEVNPQH